MNERSNQEVRARSPHNIFKRLVEDIAQRKRRTEFASCTTGEHGPVGRNRKIQEFVTRSNRNARISPNFLSVNRRPGPSNGGYSAHGNENISHFLGIKIGKQPACSIFFGGADPQDNPNSMFLQSSDGVTYRLSP